MNSFKKDLACNITLITVLSLTVIHLALLTLNLFGVFNFTLHSNFNYIVAYALVAVCLLLYIGGFFITKQKQIVFPVWFRIMFYIAFFLFTNTYYIVGAYNHIVAIAFFFAYFAFLINIICLSTFYNLQKDDKNKLKSTSSFLVTSVFLYSVGASALFNLFFSMAKVFFFPTYAFANLLTFVVEMSTMVLVSIIMSLVFSISLKKTKTLVNACLIKTVNASANKR